MGRRATVLVAVAVALLGVLVGVGLDQVDDGDEAGQPTTTDACLTTPPLVAVAGNPPDAGPGLSQVTVIRPDGSHSVATPRGWVAAHPDLSPDGRRLAVTRAEGDYESAGPEAEHLWTLGVDGSDPRPVTEGDVSDTAPAWSPDGRTLAFVRWTHPGSGILTVAAEGGEPTEVVPSDGAAVVTAPEWSPDGSRLAYVRHPSGYPGGPDEAELWTAAADGSDAGLVAPIDPSTTTLDWHPDGSRILASAVQGRPLGMSVVDLGAATVTTLARDAGFARWSRRGTHVVHFTTTAVTDGGEARLVETPVSGVDGAALGDPRDLGHTDWFLYPYLSVSVAGCGP